MIKLPQKHDDKVAILDHLRSAAEAHCNVQKVRWMKSAYWLAGVRDLVLNYQTGEVRANYRNNKEDQRGQRVALYEDVVVKVQAELGRLGRMDVRPATKAKGFGLNALQKASLAKAELEYLTGHINMEAVKTSVNYHVAVFGMCGLGANIRIIEQLEGEGDMDSQLIAQVEFEVIPPWEILPVPHNPTSPEQIEGVCRRRWVPLDWMRERPHLRLSNETEMKVVVSPYGFKPDARVGAGILGVGPTAPPASQVLPGATSMYSDSNTEKNPAKTDAKYVLLEEWYLFRENREQLRSYTVKVGDHIAFHEDYKQPGVYMPIGICTYHPVASFWGRGFAEILIPMNDASERMAQNLFQNVEDLDIYGALLFPTSWGVSRDELLSYRKKRKVAFYQPDILSPEAKMQTVSPVNFGDGPGKTLAFANNLVDRLSSQSDLLKGDAPGRVDSAAGLGFVQETSQIPLTVPAGSIAAAFTQCYKYLLAQAPSLLKGRTSIPLMNLDSSVIGLKVSPASGKIELTEGAYPLPYEVEVDIRDRLPSLPSVRIQTLLQALQAQIISPEDFRFTVWSENLDFPVGRKADRESYRKAVMQVILLFGDGQTPGQIMVSTEADNPDIHLMVLQEFMSRAEFQYAEAPVRKAFEELKQTYMNIKGQGYPQQMPYPEEAAQMAPQGPPGMVPPGMGLPPMGP